MNIQRKTFVGVLALTLILSAVVGWSLQANSDAGLKSAALVESFKTAHDKIKDTPVYVEVAQYLPCSSQSKLPVAIQRMGVRSDGSTAIEDQFTAPGGLHRKVIQEFTGRRVSMDLSTKLKSSGNTGYGRSISGMLDPATQCTTSLVKGEGWIDNPQIVGTETISGFRTTHTIMANESVRFENWYAVDYACVPIKHELWSFNKKSEAWDLSSSTELVRLQKGEPPAEMFLEPPDLSEATPSEREVAYLIRKANASGLAETPEGKERLKKQVDAIRAGSAEKDKKYHAQKLK
jgi:hypothetical protein